MCRRFWFVGCHQHRTPKLLVSCRDTTLQSHCATSGIMGSFMRFLVLVFCIILAGPAGAQVFPNPPKSHVSDGAGLFDRSQEGDIARRLKSMETVANVEVAVVTITSLQDQNAGSLESYATALFNRWGIGDATRNDGILILIARDDRKTRIELGRGYPTAADRQAAEIIDERLSPAFRRGDFAGGVLAGLDALMLSVVPMANQANSAKPPTAGAKSPLSRGMDWQTIFGGGIMVFLMAAFVIGLVWRATVNWSIWPRLWNMLPSFDRQPCPECGGRHINKTAATTIKPTVRNKGQKVIKRQCRDCGFSWSTLLILDHLNSDSGWSGGGDFGGGGSDGGGASGDW